MIIRNNLIQDSKDEISSLLNKMNPAREKLLEIFHLTNISSTKKYFSFTSNRPFFQTHHIIKNITKTKKYPIKSDSQDFISFYPFPFRKEGPSNVMEYRVEGKGQRIPTRNQVFPIPINDTYAQRARAHFIQAIKILGIRG